MKPTGRVPAIAVTGLGCITPCGHDVETLWSSLSRGVSGIASITRFDTTPFDVHVAGEVKDFDPARAGIGHKEARRLDPFVIYSIVAARQALEQSGLPGAGVDPERVGVIVGTGIGAIRSIELEVDILRNKGPSRVTPLLVPKGTPDVPSNEIAILYGFKGPSGAVSTACSSGSDSIIAAIRCLLLDEADAMVAGGAEAPVSELSLATFANVKALSRASGDPTKVCRPFDRNRSGFVLAEGAAVVVLETVESARRRGATILALLCGYGQTTDAYHKTAPDPTGEGAARALRHALARAGIAPEEVDYINAHGTSTQQNDPMETQAIKKAFGAHAYKVPVSSTKSMTGHMIAAAGALEAVIAVQSIRTGLIPPTINYETPDPDCDLFYVPNVAIEREVRTVVSNSFGFGGHNSSLIFQRAAET